MMSEFVFKVGQTVVFAGDSITDCGRRDVHAPYGAGYVHQVIDLIAARYPERSLNYVNSGISGNTVKDLRDRWHDDVLSHQPDWVTVKIGINDLHRTLSKTPEAVPPEFYLECYRDILTRTQQTGARLVLIDPFYISIDTEGSHGRAQVLKLLPEYLSAVQLLADEFKALHVNTHQLFQEQLKYRPADAMCPEPVHPNASGHLVIAHGLLKVLGW